MSELDQLYQEFYAEITATIQSDYEKFRNEKTHLTEEALIRAFCKELSRIASNIISTVKPIEVTRTEDEDIYKQNPFRILLIDQFRFHRDNSYKSDPVNHFLKDHLKEIKAEAFQRFMESSEKNEWENSLFAISEEPMENDLAKILAALEAYHDFEKSLYSNFHKQNQHNIYMTAKQTLLQWLAEGKTEQVVDALQVIAGDSHDRYFQKDVTLVASRFNGIKRDRPLVSAEHYTIQINQINQSLEDLIKQVPPNATLPNLSPPDDPPVTVPLGDSTNVPRPNSDQPTAPPATPPMDDQPISPTRYIWISAVGLLLTVGLFVAMTYFGNQLNGAQNDRAYYILLFFLGIGVAAFLFGAMRTYATWSGKVFNGNLEIGGPIVVAAAVVIGGFLLPAQNEPFNYTISLQSDKNQPLSSQYPALEDVLLELRLSNKWEPQYSFTNGDADFKSITGYFHNKSVPVRLKAKYWKLLQDSVELSGDNQVLIIAPDGMLGKIEGKVRDMTGEILPGAEVEIEGVLDTTDTRGNFNIAIPPDKQKSRYIYIAQKKDYQTKTEPFEFDGEPIEIRLRKQ